MANKPPHIQLSPRDRIPILYEDRAVLAVDKPAGWLLAPLSWQKTQRNLQAAILSSIAAGHYWARSRHLRYLRYIHRLDGDTSGVLLFAKSVGALNAFGDLFETRKIEKVYLAVVANKPSQTRWNCRLSLAPDPNQIGRMIVDKRGKAAETEFRLLASHAAFHLIEARPFTGRTHQIRVHLAKSGCPIVGDELYGRREAKPLGLRAIALDYLDPFTRKPVAIRAPVESFLATFDFPSSLAIFEGPQTLI